MPQVSTEQDLINEINAATTNYPTPHTIDLMTDITLTAVRSTMFGPNGLPIIKGVVTINGNGHAIQRSTAPSIPDFRILALNAKTSGYPLASLMLNNVAILNGKLSSAEGAALVMDGPVTITNCRIANNTGRNTGGIYVGDTFSLVATGTLFENNIATANNARGGAINKSSNSNLTLAGCVFKSNSAAATGSRGGAIHRQSGGTVIINDCSFIGNIAPANNGAAIYNSSGNINAEYNWWGAVNGPSGLGSGSGNAINGVAFDFTPFRTTLPPFTQTSFMLTNPSLPQPISGCTISVNQAVNVRRGPSIDDLNIGSDASPIQITPGQTYPLRAVATDDNGNNVWYGFEHPSYPNYLSWVVDTFAGVDYTNISCSQSANFNTQSEGTWTNTLNLTKYPIADPVDTNLFPFRGFGIDNESDYSMIVECAHPGHDFVPLNKSGRKVVAIADGIVVGMGEHGTSK